MKQVYFRLIPFDAPVYYRTGLFFGFLCYLFRKCPLRFNERIVENAFTLKNLDLPKGSKIIEFGCCQSDLALKMASLGYHVTGVDLNEYGYTHPGLRTIKGDFLLMDLEAESFDGVTAVSSVEHAGLGRYSRDRDEDADMKIMKKIYLLLKTGGKAILTVPFGKFQINKKRGYRSYDTESLNVRLINEFNVDKESYFFKEGFSWIEGKKENLEKMEYHQDVESVACLVLRK